MFRSYLTTAARNLWKHPGYAAVNVLGLSLGVAACSLLLIMLAQQRGYDTFHEDIDLTYKVVRVTHKPKAPTDHTYTTLGPVGPAMEELYPEVDLAVRLFQRWGYMTHGGRTFQGGITATDPRFFDLFDFKILRGDPETVFSEPYAAFITQDLATRLFRDDDPIGKVVRSTERYLPGDFVVRGILEDLPKNSHIRFDVLTATIPDNQFAQPYWHEWRGQTGHRTVQTYLRLVEGADPHALEAKFPRLVSTYLGEDLVDKIEYRLMPMRRIWLYSQTDWNIGWYGDVSILYTASYIAGFILLIACINYVNLATARSQSRAGEVGLRKVCGATRPQIAAQFLGESLLVAILATGLGLVGAKLLLPVFNEMTFRNVSFDLLEPVVIAGLFALVAVVGLIAGLYPAIVLSGYAPTSIAKGGVARTSAGIWLRRGLVLLQFTVTILLGLGILVIDRQMVHVENADLGFNPDHIIYVNPTGTRPELSDRLREIRREFANHPGIVASTGTLGQPGVSNRSNIAVFIPEGQPDQEYRIRMLGVDEDFLGTYEIPLLSGRNFSRDIAADSTRAFLISEKAARAFGWDSRSALGKGLRWPASENWDRPRGHVIGVYRDFAVNPLHRAIQPSILAVWNEKLLGFSMRYLPEARKDVIDHLKTAWTRYNPVLPFRYLELEQMIGWGYWQNRQLLQTTRIFGLIAAGVACLGLLGLTAFTTQQRMKEVGVRKVLGGSSGSLYRLLTSEVVYLVAVANLIAAPIGYTLTSDWLAAFHYRIDLGPTLFLIVGLGAAGVALLTVSYQTVAAIRTDPVKVLRTE